MNLLLLGEEDFLPDGSVRLAGRRLEHAREVLRAQRGDVLRVGKRGGLTGTGEIIEDVKDELRLRVSLSTPPPPRAGIDLLLAIPRPKALKRVLQAVASLGIDK